MSEGGFRSEGAAFMRSVPRWVWEGGEEDGGPSGARAPLPFLLSRSSHYPCSPAEHVLDTEDLGLP